MASDPTILNAGGVTELVLKSGVTAKVGSLIGFDGTDWVLADANAATVPSAQFVSMAYLVGDGTLKLPVCQTGVLFDVDAPYTLGADQYLSATAGAHTETIPAASSTLTVLQRIGKAVSTERVVFDLSNRGPKVMRITAAVDPSSNASDVVENLAVTVTGVLAGDKVSLADSPAIVQGVIYNGSMVVTTDTVTLGIANASAGTVNGASKTVTFIVERY